MKDAILGSTGFVGGSLLRQRTFAGHFNSGNIREASGKTFDLLVCAAAPGSMFEANRFPDEDRARIEALIHNLTTIRAATFVLISSIAVLANSAGQEDESASLFETNLAYGRNRRTLEVFCSERFDRCLIVRLPALFGNGMRKNFLFDILNPMPTMLSQSALTALSKAIPTELRAGLSDFYTWNNRLQLFVVNRNVLSVGGRRAIYDAAVTKLGMSALTFTNPHSCFQYYDVSRLWSNIELCLKKGVSIIHLAPEPLEAGQIYTALTGHTMSENAAVLYREAMWTRHANIFGRYGPYIASSGEVMDQLTRFFALEEARR